MKHPSATVITELSKTFNEMGVSLMGGFANLGLKTAPKRVP